MDKIKEELDIEGAIGWDLIRLQKGMLSRKDVSDSIMKTIYETYRSCDEEIKHLEQDCKNLITVNKNQDVIMQFRTDYVKELYHQVCIHKEKIKKLRDALENAHKLIEYVLLKSNKKKEHYNDNVVCLALKLRDSLKESE